MKRRSHVLEMVLKGLGDQITAAENLKRIAAPNGQTLAGEFQNRKALELLAEQHLRELRQVADLASLAV